MSLPEDVLLKSPHASKFVANKAEDGTPRDIQWQEFVRALEEPGPRNKSEAAKRAAKRKALAKKRAAAAGANEQQATITSATSGPAITEKELRAAHGKIRNHFATRFSEVRRGFRLLDEDHSGCLSFEEMRAVLMMFNLDIPSHILTKIIEVADLDGDGDINYAEFARIMTAEDILALKDTTSADPNGTGQRASVVKIAGLKGPAPKRVGGPTIRPGVSPKEVQYAQRMLRAEFEEKYTRLTDAFKFIDADRTGYLERDEIKRLLLEFNIVDIKDDAIETLIDFADFDGDGEINYAEFARVLTADDVLAMKNTLSALG